jgi:hypothetical protein
MELFRATSKMLCISSVWRIRQMYLHKKLALQASLTSNFYANPLGSERV